MLTRCLSLATGAAAAWLLAACGPSGADLGRLVYERGEGTDGRLAYTQGPGWLAAARGAGCAVCHGPNGEGLVVTAGAVTGAAPAITWAALAERGHDEASIRRAVTQGVTLGGRELNYYMPRWEMSEEELDALVAYLRELSRRRPALPG